MEEGSRHSSSSAKNTNPWKVKELLSASALSNNIGALLYQNGEIEEAQTRFQDAIHDSHCETKKAGLTWFLRKLERQSISQSHNNNNSNSNSSNDDHHHHHHPQGGHVGGHHLTTTCTRRGSIAEAVLTHEEFCDEKTPLGFEYFYEPLTVYQNEDVKAAAWMNVAFLQYTGESSLQTVLETLQKAKPMHNSALLKAIQQNNLGVIYFRLSQTKMSLDCLVEANKCLDEFRISNLDSSVKEEQEEGLHPTTPTLSSLDKIHTHYIQMCVLLNYARICVRLNNTQKAMALVDELDLMAKTLPTTHSNYLHATLLNRMRWMLTVANYYIRGMIHQRQENLTTSLDLYRTFLQKARHDLGHDHLHVATVLYLKGMVLFDQRKLHHAMLAQLASLRIHESHQEKMKNTATTTTENSSSESSSTSTSITFASSHYENASEMARVMYSVARTLHDREEFGDALRMYNRTLVLQKELARTVKEQNNDNNGPPISVDAVTTLCNIARVHHIIGDIEACLRDNYEIVSYAKLLSGGRKHPFVADRLVVLGNVLVEAGKMEDAMKAFADAARVSTGGDQVRSSPFDVSSEGAASLAKAGLQHPGAATA
mmetsp:Transcript_29527/g.41324  ORF Transcript_29527/g.41324 Transcript_29527/m.41324 type:complete len:598 (-) Transcript_29527:219-2012(-)